MRVLKYFQLRRDLIYLVVNFLGGDYDSLLFLFVGGTQLGSRFETIRTKGSQNQMQTKECSGQQLGRTHTSSKEELRI